ncbi:MAG: presqualene diphosphate synthase HpnD [Rhodospirillales bacterium]|nr:presqualene diphosphate synthase HpnD [Rhodospirillales bacterium]MDH3912832.1 presqualene diphosphate synthase HpnD [Rhodospirillales bacterium]MDH3918504.1 presqualene diphosphate synthase HpnD [Rhodospirillales bacterium]MDH3968832.1 presqualene diphosphate synthase HpnD [Rhodospirillales bacterium]
MAGSGTLTPAAATAATHHVHEVVRRSGTSFLWGMRVLPKARREAMFAIYAFCREVDDVADGPDAPAAKLASLEEWRAEIARLYDGRPTRPTTRALAGPVAAYGLPREEFLAVIDGMEMDARAAVVAPSLEDFALYCRRVAGAVGMLSIHAFGAEEPHAREIAVALGEALQITNILRDLAEDAAEGRLYLPRELLEAHGITARDPQAVLDHPGLASASAELAARARARFQRTRELIGSCDPRPLKPCLLMMQVYERILARLEARGWHRPRIPVRVSKAEKLWIALRYGLLG